MQRAELMPDRSRRQWAKAVWREYSFSLIAFVIAVVCLLSYLAILGYANRQAEIKATKADDRTIRLASEDFKRDSKIDELKQEIKRHDSRDAELESRLRRAADERRQLSTELQSLRQLLTQLGRQRGKQLAEIRELLIKEKRP